MKSTAARFARRLDEAGLRYARIGAPALDAQERFTTDVGVGVSAETRRRVHDLLNGLGFVPPFAVRHRARHGQTRHRRGGANPRGR